jgi:hypothetical protein
MKTSPVGVVLHLAALGLPSGFAQRWVDSGDYGRIGEYAGWRMRLDPKAANHGQASNGNFVCLPTVSALGARHIQECSNRQHPDNILTTSGQHQDNIRTTSGQHQDNIWTKP